MSAVVERGVQNPFGNAPVAAMPQGASATAVVHREIAEVQAAMTIARLNPRSPIQAVDRILNECTRPMLAQEAVYEYARGGSNVTGPSIRLAEVLARNWGNLSCGVIELSRGHGVSECLAYAWDLETNFRDEKRFQVRHWRDTKKGGHAITEERDIYELIANMGARRKRACILACIPGDVTDAALEQCNATLRTTAEVTPARIKSLVAKFAELGVSQERLEKRIQRRVDSITPALMIGLGRIYTSIGDGMSAAVDWFDPIEANPSESKPTLGTVANAMALPASQTASLKESLRARKQPEQSAPTPGPATTPPAAKVTETLGPTTEDSIRALRECGDVDSLNEQMERIRMANKEAGWKTPTDVEAVYRECASKFR